MCFFGFFVIQECDGQRHVCYKSTVPFETCETGWSISGCLFGIIELDCVWARNWIHVSETHPSPDYTTFLYEPYLLKYLF